jgi:hypothetical protein
MALIQGRGRKQKYISVQESGSYDILFSGQTSMAGPNFQITATTMTPLRCYENN